MSTQQQQFAVDYLVKKGMPLAQAQGVVGSLTGESGANLNTAAVGDNGTAFGIAQWRGPRATEFQKVIGVPVKSANLQQQLDFVLHELGSTESKAAKALSSAKTPAEAADVFTRLYERPANAAKEAVKRSATATALAGGSGARVAEMPQMSGMEAMTAALSEVNQGLPPGSVLQPQQPVADMAQAAQAAQPDWLQSLQSMGGGTMPSAQPDGNWQEADALEKIKSAAAANQERLMASMFGDSQGAQKSDTSNLPGSVDRYLDKVLAG